MDITSVTANTAVKHLECTFWVPDLENQLVLYFMFMYICMLHVCRNRELSMYFSSSNDTSPIELRPNP